MYKTQNIAECSSDVSLYDVSIYCRV